MIGPRVSHCSRGCSPSSGEGGREREGRQEVTRQHQNNRMKHGCCSRRQCVTTVCVLFLTGGSPRDWLTKGTLALCRWKPVASPARAVAWRQIDRRTSMNRAGEKCRMISTNTPLASPGAAISGANTLVPSLCVWPARTGGKHAYSGRRRNDSKLNCNDRVYTAARIQSRLERNKFLSACGVHSITSTGTFPEKQSPMRGAATHAPANTLRRNDGY